MPVGDDDDWPCPVLDRGAQERVGSPADVGGGLTVGASVPLDVPSGRAPAYLVAGQAFVVAVVVFGDEHVAVV